MLLRSNLLERALSLCAKVEMVGSLEINRKSECLTNLKYLVLVNVCSIHQGRNAVNEASTIGHDVER